MTVRPAKIEDAAAIAEICCDSLGYDCTAELVKKKLKMLDLSREAVFVAEEDKVIGFVHVEKYDVLYMDTLANILGLAVLAEYRRRGAATLLMNAAEEWAKENGAIGVRLNSGGTRTGAHEFYRSIGYDSEKTQIRFLKMI